LSANQQQGFELMIETHNMHWISQRFAKYLERLVHDPSKHSQLLNVAFAPCRSVVAFQAAFATCDVPTALQLAEYYLSVPYRRTTNSKLPIDGLTFDPNCSILALPVEIWSVIFGT
jgi:hypothetical protein